MAERVGFEPTLPFRVNTLSKRAPSATRPSLRRKPGKDDSFPEGYRIGWNSHRPSFISFYGQGRTSANRQQRTNDSVAGTKTQDPNKRRSRRVFAAGLYWAR